MVDVVIITVIILSSAASCLILYFVCVHLSPDLLIREVDQDATTAPPAEVAEDAEELCSDSPPPLKHQRLLSCYKAFKMQHNTMKDSSITAQISKYLDNMNDYDCDALTFWSKNQEHFPNLHIVALKVLSVPASSAPVERVFSRGGILMRPHRAWLGHKMLQFLVFLKRNQQLF